MDRVDIDVSALSPFYQTLSDLVGVEQMIKLYDSYCGGMFRFPNHLYKAKFVIGKIVQEFDGNNANLLARKFGYSEQWLRIRLWQHGCGDRLLSLDPMLSIVPVIEGDLDYEMLHPFYRDFYQLLGSKYLKILYMAFHGIKIEFPPYLYDADLVARTVLKQYNGHNKKQLILRYGYGKDWIDDVLNWNQE
ncbi:hypothetical protein ACPZ2A_12555 [Lactiplantibacillus plantarum]|uniref:Uncharacterized protein n=1 Tax=Lactiplantibacillus plantarum TaxID=1590 RepID=A0A162EYB5_LACPN|nr:hypothetical protein [Lactiplantibacillus plantarum]AJO75226.1 hypothetical protein SH83_13145 [Lactiplantibacillus plantarum]KKX44190.1 hypothetical protein WH27_14255 [Lactiplantibacillus plantarum]KZU92995.1 hypothetical protein Lp19_2698 [Lactiplantibacillus plantarum]MCW0154072.1 hypothetical protein [Lactiplantibacillus plantarum]MDG6770235.1 hypothetical protein [Lactiplantibacillus plantarum]